MALLTAGGGSEAALTVVVLLEEDEEERLDEERRRREMMPTPPTPQSATRESAADLAAVAFRTPTQARGPVGTSEPIIIEQGMTTTCREGAREGKKLRKEGKEKNKCLWILPTAVEKISPARVRALCSSIRLDALDGR